MANISKTLIKFKIYYMHVSVLKYTIRIYKTLKRSSRVVLNVKRKIQKLLRKKSFTEINNVIYLWYPSINCTKNYYNRFNL